MANQHPVLQKVVVGSDCVVNDSARNVRTWKRFKGIFLYPPPPPRSRCSAPLPARVHHGGTTPVRFISAYHGTQHLDFGGCFRAQRDVVAVGRHSECVRRVDVERSGEVRRQEGERGNAGGHEGSGGTWGSGGSEWVGSGLPRCCWRRQPEEGAVNESIVAHRSFFLCFTAACP